jgi:acyl homoserine lactone synthase
MIEAFSLATAHLFQDALASQARLRYRIFVEKRGLDHPHFDELEYDQFDTPAAVYLVWRDPKRIVRGLTRLLRTTMPYMMKTYWPYTVEDRALPSSPDIWEVTRVCVDKSFDPEVRKTIFPELLCAVSEYFEMYGIAAMVGVTRPHLLAHFVRSGISWMGKDYLIEGEMERAFFVPRAYIRPVHHCERYGLPARVLKLPAQGQEKLAA